MKIVVLGDTHIPKRAKVLPNRLLEELKSVDLILHTGDWQTLSVYEKLTQYAPVKGVVGNVDNDEIRGLFPEKDILSINDKKIGLVHGHGIGKTTEKRAIETFKDEQLDCIIYGHSHIPIYREVEGTLLFNPGSVTDKRRQPMYSFGIITITDRIDVSHIYF